MAADDGGAGARDGIRLRAMGIGEALSETFRLYRRHFLSFVAVMAVMTVPATLLSVVISLGLGLDLERWQPRRFSFEEIAPFVTGILVVLVLYALIGLLYQLANIAAIQLSSNAIVGRPVELSDAYRVAVRQFGHTLWAGFLSGLAVALLAMTCIGIPFAFYFGVGWTVIFPVVLAEGLHGTAALRRSSALVGGHRWRVFFTMLLIGSLVGIITSVPLALVGGGVTLAGLLMNQAQLAIDVVNAIINPILTAIANSLFGSLTWITMTLLYYELRMRKEAFDLEQPALQPESAPSDDTDG